MNRHPFDPISFLFGLLFAGLGLTFLFGDFRLWDLGWSRVWPVPVIFLGALILSIGLNSHFKRERESQSDSSESLSPVVK